MFQQRKKEREISADQKSLARGMDFPDVFLINMASGQDNLEQTLARFQPQAGFGLVSRNCQLQPFTAIDYLTEEVCNAYGFVM